jgi:hypothetical protein
MTEPATLIRGTATISILVGPGLDSVPGRDEEDGFVFRSRFRSFSSMKQSQIRIEDKICRSSRRFDAESTGVTQLCLRLAELLLLIHRMEIRMDVRRASPLIPAEPS